ncbi:MAG: hypothetical protein A4E72_00702 [Syntrophus sp. PtaU1.Bin208]|nr:MAG: hypothetical protein A4E72_00702 [Syntrophus sp. PtaU1.Bin208]
MKEKRNFAPWFVYGVTLFFWVYTYLDKARSLSGGVHLYREYGLVENATNVMLLLAILLYLLCLKKAESLWEKGWLLILAAGAFYFLGEEISWGYHFFHYNVDDSWRALNDQKEPNLHNLKGIWEILFDKLPRQLLSIGTVIGGLLGAYAARRRSWPKNRALHRLIPSGHTLFVAVSANLVSVPERIGEHLLSEMPRWLKLGNDAGELKECFLALFILLYAHGLFRRFSSLQSRV